MKKLILLALCIASTGFGAPAKVNVDTKTRAVTVDDGVNTMDYKGVTLTLGNVTISDSSGIRTISLGSTNGVKVGATGDKLGFLGATPIVRPGATTDLRQALINLGLYTTGGASPLNLNGGAFTAATGSFSGAMDADSGVFTDSLSADSITADTGAFSGALTADSVAATTGTFIASISITSADDSGLDLNFGTTVTRRGSDGHLRLTSQNNVTEIVGRVNVTDTFNLASGGEISVVKYGAVGDGVTNDTASFNLAIAAANSAKQTLFIPSGVYLITPGALDDISCSVEGPNADILAADATDAPLISINYSPGKTHHRFKLRRIVGFDLGVGNSVGSGLYLKNGDYNQFDVMDIGFFRAGIHLDGSGNDTHVGVNVFNIATIYGCNFGILLNAGSDNQKECEANVFYVTYINQATVSAIGIGVGGVYPTTNVDENIFHIQSIEAAADSDGIYVTSAGKRNVFNVSGIFGVSGTGKLIRSSGSDNHFRICTPDWSNIDNSGNDIFDTFLNAGDGSGRSQIAGASYPMEGNWRIGDICWNNASVTPVGWRCVVAGTPGTWDTILGGTQPAFIAPTLINSWVNFGSGYQTAGYYKDGSGRVWLTGMIKDGTAIPDTSLFVLPAGYRPVTSNLFVVNSNFTFGTVQVTPDGNVSIKAGTNAWLSFEGISFRTD